MQVLEQYLKELLKIPQLATLNLHAGDLPKYRGGSPLNWHKLINGESFFQLQLFMLTQVLIQGELCQAKK